MLKEIWLDRRTAGTKIGGCAVYSWVTVPCEYEIPAGTTLWIRLSQKTLAVVDNQSTVVSVRLEDLNLDEMRFVEHHIIKAHSCSCLNILRALYPFGLPFRPSLQPVTQSHNSTIWQRHSGEMDLYRTFIDKLFALLFWRSLGIYDFIVS